MPYSCQSCGVCCKLFLINLSKVEYYSGQYQTVFQEYGIIKNFTQARNCGANILAQHPDGSCLYLKNKKCSIHATRPQVCRQFFCTSKAKKFSAMIQTIKSVLP
ncbi:MAG: YkgJ family cysteine cluster protein [Candidatus Shapirobacteria bacterium]|jgi:Fe-S-cluster containining protein